MTTEQIIKKINDNILEEIRKLHIEPIAEADKMWKVEVLGECVNRRRMDGAECYINLDGNYFVVADDSKDFQSFHVLKSGYQNKDFKTESSNETNFDVAVEFVVLSNKKMAFPIVFEAFRRTGRVNVVEYLEDYNYITQNYFVSNDKKWGSNPYYRAMIINYKITVPYIDKPNYSITD